MQYPRMLGFQFFFLGVHLLHVSIVTSLPSELNTYPEDVCEGMDCKVNDVDPNDDMRNNVSQALSVRHEDADILQ